MQVTIAETTPAPAILVDTVDTKAVIRCKKCQLNQFMTRQGNCRRCRYPLLCEEPPVILPECLPVQTAGPVRPSIDMATAIWLLRSARGLSQRDMAKKMGIARTYISKLEGNRCVPSPPQIRRIADILEVSEYCLVALATVHNQSAPKQ